MEDILDHSSGEDLSDCNALELINDMLGHQQSKAVIDKRTRPGEQVVVLFDDHVGETEGQHSHETELL